MVGAGRLEKDMRSSQNILHIICSSGHWLPEEQTRLFCSSDGEWAPKPMQCVPLECPVEINSNPNGSSGSQEGETPRLVCRKGHSLVVDNRTLASPCMAFQSAQNGSYWMRCQRLWAVGGKSALSKSFHLNLFLSVSFRNVCQEISFGSRGCDHFILTGKGSVSSDESLVHATEKAMSNGCNWP